MEDRPYRKSCPRRAAVLSACLLISGLAPAEEPTQGFSAELVPERLEAVSEAIRTAVREGGEGVLAVVGGRQLVELPQARVADLARKRSLAVQVQVQGREQARAFADERDAAFDLVVNFNVNHQRNDFFARSEVIARDRIPDVDFEELQRDARALAAGQPNPQSRFFCVVVDGVLVNEAECASETQTEFSALREFASFDLDTTHSTGIGLDLIKPLRFGGRVDFFVQSTHRKKDFYNLGFLNEPLDLDDPIGLGSRFPWTSFIGVEFSTPVPFARNFGTHGNFDNVSLRLAGIAEEQADWNLAATVNTVVGEVLTRYWTLVGAMETLHATRSHRETLEQIFAGIQRLYDQRLITSYDYSQVQADLENVRNQEEIAWSAYVVTSNALAELLDYEPSTLILPVDLSFEDPSSRQLDAQRARQTALGKRYELKAGEAEIRSAEEIIRFRENQTRPDISVVASVNYAQSDAAIGYRNWGGSLWQLLEPDSSNYFIGIFYRLPFGHKAERSALSQARAQSMQAQDQYGLLELGITEQVNSAVASVSSAALQSELARTNLELAQSAYERAERLQGLGLATQFELLRTFSDLLDARLAHIGASVAYQQALVNLQAAQGLYSE